MFYVLNDALRRHTAVEFWVAQRQYSQRHFRHLAGNPPDRWSFFFFFFCSSDTGVLGAAATELLEMIDVLQIRGTSFHRVVAAA